MGVQLTDADLNANAPPPLPDYLQGPRSGLRQLVYILPGGSAVEIHDLVKQWGHLPTGRDKTLAVASATAGVVGDFLLFVPILGWVSGQGTRALSTALKTTTGARGLAVSGRISTAVRGADTFTEAITDSWKALKLPANSVDRARAIKAAERLDDQGFKLKDYLKGVSGSSVYRHGVRTTLGAEAAISGAYISELNDPRAQVVGAALFILGGVAITKPVIGRINRKINPPDAGTGPPGGIRGTDGKLYKSYEELAAINKKARETGQISAADAQKLTNIIADNSLSITRKIDDFGGAVPGNAQLAADFKDLGGQYWRMRVADGSLYRDWAVAAATHALTRSIRPRVDTIAQGFPIGPNTAPTTERPTVTTTENPATTNPGGSADLVKAGLKGNINEFSDGVAKPLPITPPETKTPSLSLPRVRPRPRPIPITTEEETRTGDTTETDEATGIDTKTGELATTTTGVRVGVLEGTGVKAKELEDTGVKVKTLEDAGVKVKVKTDADALVKTKALAQTQTAVKAAEAEAVKTKRRSTRRAGFPRHRTSVKVKDNEIPVVAGFRQGIVEYVVNYNTGKVKVAKDLHPDIPNDHRAKPQSTLRVLRTRKLTKEELQARKDGKSLKRSWQIGTVRVSVEPGKLTYTGTPRTASQPPNGRVRRQPSATPPRQSGRVPSSGGAPVRRNEPARTSPPDRRPPTREELEQARGAAMRSERARAGRGQRGRTETRKKDKMGLYLRGRL